MPTIKYKPTTPARRNMSVPSFDELTKFTPEKSLLATKKKNAGRNSYGRITVRHKGGGNRQKYRIIDFKRQNTSAQTVIGVEYDPNRSSYIALLQDEAGKKSYILAPVGVTDGAVLYSGENADIVPGNTLPLANIPVGTFINSIELIPGKSEQWLMLAWQDDADMAFQGKDAPCAMCEVKLYGASTAANYNRLTGALCRILEEEAGIPQSRVYVTYDEVEHWGFDGENF